MPKPGDASPGKKYFHTGIGGRGNYNRHGRAAKEAAAAAATAAAAAQTTAVATSTATLPSSSHTYQRNLDTKSLSRSSMTASSTGSTTSLPPGSAVPAAASFFPSTQPPSYKAAISAMTGNHKSAKWGKPTKASSLAPSPKASKSMASKASTISLATVSAANDLIAPVSYPSTSKISGHSHSAPTTFVPPHDSDVPRPLNVPFRNLPSTPVPAEPSQHALFAFDEEIERVARARGGGKFSGTPPSGTAALPTMMPSTLPPTYYAGLSMAASGTSVDSSGAGRLNSSGGPSLSKNGAGMNLGAGMNMGMGTNGVAGRPHGTPGHVPSSACTTCVSGDKESKGVKGYLERVSKRNGPGRWVAKVGGVGH